MVGATGTTATVGATSKRGDSPDENIGLKSAYRKLQNVVGIIAVTLCPIVVGLDHLFGDPDGLRGSVSAYYYGFGRNWFVGGLIAVAVFFLSYQSKPQRVGFEADKKLSTFAAACAAGVAFAPTAENDNPTGRELIVDYIHGISAGLLFISLAVFSLYHFTKTGYEEEDPSTRDQLMRFVRTDWVTIEAAARANRERIAPQKKTQHRIYRVCGWLIVTALLLIVITFFFELGSLFFWAEVLAVTAFGISWLVKGRVFGMLKDDAGPSWDDMFPFVRSDEKSEDNQGTEDAVNPARKTASTRR